MSIQIQNLTNRPVLLRLNSGQTLHIGPLQASGALSDVEVESNTIVEKLKDKHIIAIKATKKAEESRVSAPSEAEKNEIPPGRSTKKKKAKPM